MSMNEWIAKNESRLLKGIIILAVLLRLGVAVLLGNQIQELPGISDQITYHTLANRVIQGEGFSFDRPWWPATQAGEPTAHWSYLYTFYLALVYKIFGEQPILARIFQVLLVGVFQPIILFAITKSIFGRKAALLSAAWIAVYPYLVYYAAALITESFFITLLLAVFWKSIQIKNMNTNWKDYLQLGFLIGPMILLRQVVLLFIPFLFLWIFWIQRKTPLLKNLSRFLLAGVITLAFILPFTLYNFQRFQQFVLLNTNAGFAFYWSNHPVYDTNFVGILPPEMGTYLDLLPPELMGLNEAALDSALLSRGLEFVVQDPGRYFLLSISRIPVFFEFWPSSGSSLLSNFSRVLSFGLAFPFMLVGIFLSLKQTAREKIAFFDSPIALILLFGIVYTGIHLLSWSLVRYRVPIDALFLSFAGYAIARIIDRVPAQQIRPVSQESA